MQKFRYKVKFLSASNGDADIKDMGGGVLSKKKKSRSSKRGEILG